MTRSSGLHDASIKSATVSNCTSSKDGWALAKTLIMHSRISRERLTQPIRVGSGTLALHWTGALRFSRHLDPTTGWLILICMLADPFEPGKDPKRLSQM